MTIGEGASVAHAFRNDVMEPSTSFTVLSRMGSRVSASVLSLATFMPTQGSYAGQLVHLAQFISQYTALYYASIVSTECYSETMIAGISHRFLLMELSRPTKKRIWLRLDRRRSKIVSTTRFVGSGGSTPANDTVRVTSLSPLIVMLQLLP